MFILSKIVLLNIAISFFLFFNINLDAESYVYPLLSEKVSSNFGTRKHPIKKIRKHHNGIDLAVPADTPVRAIRSGKIVFSDVHKGYGNLITIMHNLKDFSLYGHLKSFNVEIGQEVKSGQIIGFVGSSGLATGPHLHLEIIKDGKAINPKKVLKNLGNSAEG